MAGPTPEQRDAIKFYNPVTERSRRIKFEHIKKWRGSHKQCSPGHRNGTCAAANGWKVMDRTWSIVPDFAIVNIEENAMGTVQELGKKGAYPEPTWKAKGWVEVEEAEGVVATEEVKRHLIDRLVNMKKIDLEHKKAEYETVERECRKLREAAEAANGLGVKAKGKSDG